MLEEIHEVIISEEIQVREETQTTIDLLQEPHQEEEDLLQEDDLLEEEEEEGINLIKKLNEKNNPISDTYRN